jgi:hypothetical protein
MLPPTSYDKPSLITKGGKYWKPSMSLWVSLSEVYGVQLCRAEYFKAWAWLEANERRRKTVRGMPRFLNNWMSKAWKEQAKRPQQVSVDKDWSDVPPEQLEAMRAKYEARGKG